MKEIGVVVVKGLLYNSTSTAARWNGSKSWNGARPGDGSNGPVERRREGIPCNFVLSRKRDRGRKTDEVNGSKSWNGAR